MKPHIRHGYLFGRSLLQGVGSERVGAAVLLLMMICTAGTLRAVEHTQTPIKEEDPTGAGSRSKAVKDMNTAELERTNPVYGDPDNRQRIDRIKQLMAAAADLTGEEVKALERRLKNNPKDLVTRIRLIGCYCKSGQGQEGDDGSSRKASRKASRKLVLGIIDHHPRSELAGAAYTLLPGDESMGMDDGYWAEGAKKWVKLTKANSSDPVILGNAGTYLNVGSLSRVITLFERACQLDPGNPKWARLLGEHYLMHARLPQTPQEQRPVVAQKALDYLEKANQLIGEPNSASVRYVDYCIFEQLAIAAFTANAPGQAKINARKMLQSASQIKDTWNYGNVLHTMNIILGRIALREGDVDGAKRHLMEAANPGSSQLNFSPDAELARELLDKGESKVVIQYVDLCRTLSKYGCPKIDRLRAEIERTVPPGR